LIAARREDVVHPTINEQLAKEIQRDRLVQAAQWRLARGAREQPRAAQARAAAPVRRALRAFVLRA
jgi:hypothetical protein